MAVGLKKLISELLSIGFVTIWLNWFCNGKYCIQSSEKTYFSRNQVFCLKRMKTSRSSKSSKVYYFSLIFCTHILHISAYITSECENHFSLFCCADINKKRKAWFREAFIVFLNAFWFQKKYRKKRSLTLL